MPLRERQLDERLSVDLEHVEEVEHERARSLLHRREARPAPGVERADLAVEHAVGRLDRLHDRSSDGLEARRQRLAVAARQLGNAARNRHDRAVAVPLHLVQPAVAGRHRVGGCGEHRPIGPLLPRRRLVASSSSRAASSSDRRRASPGRASMAHSASRRGGAPSCRRLASPRRARRCPGPRSRPSRRRSCPRGSHPRTSRT